MGELGSDGFVSVVHVLGIYILFLRAPGQDSMHVEDYQNECLQITSTLGSELMRKRRSSYLTSPFASPAVALFTSLLRLGEGFEGLEGLSRSLQADEPRVEMIRYLTLPCHTVHAQ